MPPKRYVVSTHWGHHTRCVCTCETGVVHQEYVEIEDERLRRCACVACGPLDPQTGQRHCTVRLGSLLTILERSTCELCPTPTWTNSFYLQSLDVVNNQLHGTVTLEESDRNSKKRKLE